MINKECYSIIVNYKLFLSQEIAHLSPLIKFKQEFKWLYKNLFDFKKRLYLKQHEDIWYIIS